MHSRPHAILALGTSLLLTAAVAALGSLWTISEIPTWYAALTKPAFSPPNALFGPVWTTLYLLMAIAAWLIWQLPDSPRRTAALTLYLSQLALNLLWPFLFFRLHHLRAALIEIVLLLVAVIATTWLFARPRPLAAALLIPYILWTAFATALNAAILHRNS